MAGSFARTVLTLLVRLGYASRGIVYLIIGSLAIMTAFGQGGSLIGGRGVLKTIVEQPFGRFMLGALIVGLLGYIGWRFYQSIKDTDNHGVKPKGLAVRIGLFVSGVTHASLALVALGLVVQGFDFGGAGGSSGGSGSPAGQGWLNSTWGQYLFAFVGACVVGAGVAHIYKGWKAKFEKHMNMPTQHHHWMQPVCRFGLIARGLVWGLIGWFFIRSALIANNSDISGLEEALTALRDAAYGPYLLGVAAAGLFAFGVYSVLEAFYRRVNF